MKQTTKLIVLLPKPPFPLRHRRRLLLLLLLLSLPTAALLLFSLLPKPPPPPPTSHLLAALLHHTSLSNSTDKLSPAELRLLSSHLLRHVNLLVFGLPHETLLYLSLNPAGRTIFVDESPTKISHFEALFPQIEAYDIQFPTRVSNFRHDVETSRANHECRPVQNLLFSECELAINDMPNHVYDIPWDVILVDGPRGYCPECPGRVAAVFTAAVLARSKRGGACGSTHVFVHDFGREVERVSSEEFLCMENLIEVVDGLGYFVIERATDGHDRFDFCLNKSSSVIV